MDKLGSCEFRVSFTLTLTLLTLGRKQDLEPHEWSFWPGAGVLGWTKTASVKCGSLSHGQWALEAWVQIPSLHLSNPIGMEETCCAELLSRLKKYVCRRSQESWNILELPTLPARGRKPQPPISGPSYPSLRIYLWNAGHCFVLSRSNEQNRWTLLSVELPLRWGRQKPNTPTHKS